MQVDAEEEAGGPGGRDSTANDTATGEQQQLGQGEQAMAVAEGEGEEGPSASVPERLCRCVFVWAVCLVLG